MQQNVGWTDGRNAKDRVSERPRDGRGGEFQASKPPRVKAAGWLTFLVTSSVRYGTPSRQWHGSAALGVILGMPCSSWRGVVWSFSGPSRAVEGIQWRI